MDLVQLGKIIAIEGLVGIGKSTFAKILEDHTKVIFLREPVDENEYLYDFYRDMDRWAFSMQMELLYRRFEQHWTAQTEDGVYVFDRSIIGDRVFADMLHDDGHITNREYRTYLNTHRIMTDKLQVPDLILYLDGKPQWAYDRLRKRDREQEEGVPLSYLENMERYYKKTFFRKPSNRLVKNVRRLNWRENDQYNAPIIGQLRSEFGI